MAIGPGVRIGPYEVTALLGEGGMGKVWRAHHTALKRDDALKVLPEAFASDPERLARFQREAQVLASLNHPNIAQIYGLEGLDGQEGREGKTIALVLELVDGPTLAAKLASAPGSEARASRLPIEEALPIAKQIADALEAAHEKGIIHRDLKPANVMVTHDGIVKVLDFGLAAIPQVSSPHGVDLTHSPTLTVAATRSGVILGTAAYMSPEQAAGKPVDKRADIWSFGVMVWEMLVGHQLFSGETISHTLADVLRADIDFGKLPSATPPAIQEILRRCLDRDTKSRLRDIGEARVAIQKYLANPAAGVTRSDGATAPTARRRSVVAAWSVAALSAALAAAVALAHFRERPPEAEPVRFQLLPPGPGNFINSVTLSPDGRRFAFEFPGPDGRPMLWMRSMDSLEAHPVSGSEGAVAGPIWSPDNRFVVFATGGFTGRLKKVDVSGGPPQTLYDFIGGYRSGSWSSSGVILFGLTTGVWQIPETGGAASQVTAVDPARREIQHSGPVFLPDGRTFLYHRTSSIAENAGIYRGSLDAAPAAQSSARLWAADSNPAYVRSSDRQGGLILFLREGTLVAQPVDDRGQPKGNAIPVAEDVGSLGQHGWFSASAHGDLAIRTGRVAAASNDLVWFDRQGKKLGQLGPRIELGAGGPQLSPDGRVVAVTRTNPGDPGSGRIWTADVSRGIFSRLNTGDDFEGAPAISPDGRIAFSSRLNGAVGDLYLMAANGLGSPQPLLVKSPTVKHPNGFSPDGRFLIYDDHTSQRQDLWILPMDVAAGGERKPIPFLVTRADETFGQFSPDGKWIAYSSDESGRREVFVQGFAPDRVPAAAVRKWQISTAGGDKPRWRADGKELYYVAPDRKMMAVPVKLGDVFEPGLAVPLFETNVTSFIPYDVSPDGRFLLNTIVEAQTPTASPVTIVLNWESALRK